MPHAPGRCGGARGGADYGCAAGLAKGCRLVGLLQRAATGLPTGHRLWHGDTREADWHDVESVHLVLTLPPYWTLKPYWQSDGQMGEVVDYERFVG